MNGVWAYAAWTAHGPTPHGRRMGLRSMGLRRMGHNRTLEPGPAVNVDSRAHRGRNRALGAAKPPSVPL
jgi:hypothetical protein